MKIVYIYDALARVGGIERILTDKLNYMVEHYPYELFLITTSQGIHKYPFPLSPKVKHIDIDVRFHLQYKHKFPKRLILKRKMDRHFKERLNKEIQDINPDIIIGTTFFKAYEICNLKCNAKKIIESHCSKEHSNIFNRTSKSSFIQYLYDLDIQRQFRFIEKKSDALVTLTQGDACEWIHAKNLFTIPNLFSHIPLESSTCTTHKVIAAGRFVYQKGFDRLIKAWQIVYNYHPDWNLSIYGEGEDKALLEYLITQYQLEHAITMYPFTSDITKEYLNSSIYVLSSNYEGFGLVLIEAMACGLPCVSFDCPHGPSDIIKDQEDGILVKNGDIEEMAKAICQLIENENQRISFGKKAKENVSRFLPEKIIPKWNLLFNNLIKK